MPLEKVSEVERRNRQKNAQLDAAYYKFSLTKEGAMILQDLEKSFDFNEIIKAISGDNAILLVGQTNILKYINKRIERGKEHGSGE